MSEIHYFTLRTTSNKVAILVMMAAGGVGFFVGASSFAFILSAVVIGLLFGVADTWHFFGRKWPRAIAVVVLVILAAEARDLFFAKLALGARYLASLQFMAFALIAATAVVQIKESVARKENHG